MMNYVFRDVIYFKKSSIKRRKEMRKIAVILILFLCIGCGTQNSSIDVREPYTAEIQDISIIQLIANPNKFHHTKVRIIGFAIIEFEGTAMYLSREFADYGLSKNAIWLDIEHIKQFETFKQYDRKYVLVEGIFDKNDLGHISSCSGAIKSISRIEEWKKIQ
jgi:hypothetical protein